MPAVLVFDSIAFHNVAVRPSGKRVGLVIKGSLSTKILSAAETRNY
jgi:hypothetical protein